MSQTTRGTTDTQRSHSSAQRAKAKGKAIASVASLERIESGDETPSQSHSLSRSVQRMTATRIAVPQQMMAVIPGSRWSRLHNLRVVNGLRSNILHMPLKIQIMELDKVLVKFMRGRERRRGRGRQWMNMNKCDRAYMI